MAVIFKYKDKTYQAINLDKKLKRLKISSSDIDTLYSGELSQSELEKKFLEFTREEKEIPNESWHNPKLYRFYNKKDKTTILSIYDSLDNLKNNVNVNDYERLP